MEDAASSNKSNKRFLLDLNIKLMYWQGMWYEDPEPDLAFYLHFYSEKWAHRMVESPRLRQLSWWLRNGWSRYCVLHGVYSIFIVAPASIYVMWENKQHVVENIYNVALNLLVNIGILTAIAYKKDYRDTIDNLEVLLQKMARHSPHQWELLLNTRRLCEAITYYLHVMVVPSTWLSVLLMLVFQLIPRRALYTPQWHPVDTAVSPYYEIIVATQTIQIITAVLLANTLMTFGLSKVIFSGKAFNLTCNIFENIREISLQSLLSRQSGTEVEMQISADVETRDNSSTPTDVISTQLTGVTVLNNGLTEHRALLNSREEPDEHSTPTNQELGPNEELVDPAVASLPAGITKQDLDDEMERQLQSIIALHEGLLRTTNKAVSLEDPPFIMLFLVNTVILAVSLLILESGENLSIAGIVTCVTFSSQVMALFMLHNYLAGVITDASSAIVEAVYFSDWLDASPRFKRSMLIIMTRATVPVELKPTGLDPLSLRNFTEVSKNAYRMIATLKNM